MDDRQVTCKDCINYRRIRRGETIFKVFCRLYPGVPILSRCISFIARKK